MLGMLGGMVLAAAVVLPTKGTNLSLEEKFQPDEISIESGGFSGKFDNASYIRQLDGSAEFHVDADPSQDAETISWSVSCHVDAMDDSRYCQIWVGDLIVSYGPKCQVYVVAVGTDHFPGTTSLVRIDGRKPYSTAEKDGVFQGKAAGVIAAELRKAKRATTRFVRWPYRSPVDTDSTMSGFSQASDYACWAVKRLPSSNRKK
jgi:hypothetical protein